MDKLTGTPEQFMHASYFSAKVAALDSVAETEVRADYGGEDGLTTELMRYGLILGQAVDEVWEEVQEFPGVPAYDLSEETAAEWMYAWLLDDKVASWPSEQAWRMLCKNMIRAWCDGKLEEFMALPRVYQTELCHKEINPYTLYDGAKFPNGERIDVDAVAKYSKDCDVPLNFKIATLSDMPSGTQLVSFKPNYPTFWKTENGKFHYFRGISHGIEVWISTTRPSNAIECQKLMMVSENIVQAETKEEAKELLASRLARLEREIEQVMPDEQQLHEDQLNEEWKASNKADPELKTPHVEQELNFILTDKAEKSVELKPDREITEPVITKVHSLLEYKGLRIEGADGQMEITYEGLEIVIVDGKVEMLNIPGLNV